MDRIHPSVYERADEGLLRLLKKANIAALTDEELDYYEASMKALEDEMDQKEIGIEIGMERGMEKGMVEGCRKKSVQIAMEMKKDGVAIDSISKWTGLEIEEIEKL